MVKISLPTSTLDLIQIMGRRVRNLLTDGANPTDDFFLFLSLSDFVHLNESLHQHIDDYSKINFTGAIKHDT